MGSVYKKPPGRPDRKVIYACIYIFGDIYEQKSMDFQSGISRLVVYKCCLYMTLVIPSMSYIHLNMNMFELSPYRPSLAMHMNSFWPQSLAPKQKKGLEKGAVGGNFTSLAEQLFLGKTKISTVLHVLSQYVLDHSVPYVRFCSLIFPVVRKVTGLSMGKRLGSAYSASYSCS